MSFIFAQFLLAYCSVWSAFSCPVQSRKGAVNCNYFLRKWGCRSEKARQWVRSLHDTCQHKTPFGKDLPVWYWRTTKQQREHDKEVRHTPGLHPGLLSVRSCVFWTCQLVPGSMQHREE